MKHRVVICAGNNSFEFEGEIVEFDDTQIVLKSAQGNIFIERKYLVFIQFVEEKQDEGQHLEEKRETKRVKAAPKHKYPKIDEAEKLIKKQLRYDPIEEKLRQKLVPPSQLPEDDEEDYYGASSDEDLEAARNALSSFDNIHPALKSATTLQQAAKMVMKNEEEDFSMGGGDVKYKSPTQTVLSLINGKKARTR